MTSMPLLEACRRFVALVSPEAVAATIAAIERGEAAAADARLTGDAARLFRDIRSSWAQTAPQLTQREVSLLLAGALHAVSEERQRVKVELVGSGPAGLGSSLRSTEPALLQLLGSCRTSVYVVTFAAYKVPAVAQAIRAARARGVRVVFVLESDEASDGKVSFDPLPYLLSDGGLAVEVYSWPLDKRPRDSRGRHGTLHAKFAVADRQQLLVSSANLTEYAFALNMELGVLITGGNAPEEAAEHVDELIRLGILQRQFG
jgi:phosphatidylserine/phosphatidylglycerophosphate/cardiolipin synthase-like enzyme